MPLNISVCILRLKPSKKNQKHCNCKIYAHPHPFIWLEYFTVPHLETTFPKVGRWKIWYREYLYHKMIFFDEKKIICGGITDMRCFLFDICSALIYDWTSEMSCDFGNMIPQLVWAHSYINFFFCCRNTYTHLSLSVPHEVNPPYMYRG